MSEDQAKIKMDGYERLKLENFNDDGADALVRAICERAADDWRQGMRTELKHPERGATRYRVDAERFFLSGYFNLLTGLDGSWVLAKLRKDMGL